MKLVGGVRKQPATDQLTPGNAWVSTMAEAPPEAVPLEVSCITDLGDGMLARATQSQLVGIVPALTTCTNPTACRVCPEH